jgi:putative membrane protein
MAAAIVITQFHLQIGKPLLKKGVQQIKLKWSKAS